MAALTVQTVQINGKLFTTASAAGGGDTFVNDGKTILYIKNDSGGDITVTVAAQNQVTIDGNPLTLEDVPVIVSAGQEKFMGPFPTQFFNNSAGSVEITYSGVTSLSVRPVSMP